MKKSIALMLTLCTAAALTACSSGGDSSSDQTTAAETTAAETEDAAAAADTDSDAAEAEDADTETADTDADAIDTSSIPGLEDGVLTIAMECAYAPYNWTQFDDSNGAVLISGTTNEYANGYDVMIGKMICDHYGWDLEVIRTDWDSLVPGVESGIYDAVIAGQSMTEERSKVVDFAGPYYYASVVCLTREGSGFEGAQGLNDLAGGSCTAQIATIWYDNMLPQIVGANVQTAAETAPAMLMALETGTVDFVCTDMPTAMAACIAYDDFILLDFSDGDDDFIQDAGDVNIGISLMKGNTQLLDAINAVLDEMTVDDFNAIMDEAIAIQPLSEEE